jgi:hypothetical protein
MKEIRKVFRDLTLKQIQDAIKIWTEHNNAQKRKSGCYQPLIDVTTPPPTKYPL